MRRQGQARPGQPPKSAPRRGAPASIGLFESLQKTLYWLEGVKSAPLIIARFTGAVMNGLKQWTIHDFGGAPANIGLFEHLQKTVYWLEGVKSAPFILAQFTGAIMNGLKKWSNLDFATFCSRSL